MLRKIFTYRLPCKLLRSEKAWVLSDQLLVSAVSFLTTMLAARRLDIQQFAWFTAIVLGQYLLLSIQQALFTSPVQVLQADYQTQESRKEYLNDSFLLQAGFALAIASAAGLLLLLIPGIPAAISQSAGWIMLATSGFLLQDYLRRILIIEKKAYLAFGIDALTNVLQLVILAWLFFIHQVNLQRILMVIGLTYIPSVISGISLLHVKKTNANKLRVIGRRHYKHGRWLLLTALLQWWAGNSFFLAAGLFLGVQTFAALRLAQNIFGILNVLFQAFENYIIPNAAVIYKQSADGLRPYLQNVLLKSAAYILPILLVIVVFAKFIFNLAGGPQYVPFAVILQGMSILYLLIFLGYPVRIAIRVLLLNRSFFLAYSITAVFSFLAARSFIEWWGVNGVIAGLVLNQLLMVSYWYYVLRHEKTATWK